MVSSFVLMHSGFFLSLCPLTTTRYLGQILFKLQPQVVDDGDGVTLITCTA